MILSYSSGMILFENNFFLTTKKISTNVDFVVYDLNGIEMFRLGHRDLYLYQIFYIDQIFLDPGRYTVKIFETETDRCIFNDILDVK